MTFRVGEKVVCIKRGPWAGGGYFGEINPEYGVIYTVREICHWPRHIGIRLFEIRNEPHDYAEGFNECDFYAGNFRPIVSRQTDISIFRAMLNPSKVDA